ncbi:histidine phosphatase family protein [Allorhizobium pseudoryzae]|uniref:histidine phosphatase family protein n=1 Tax=Allorhizobium pseudoryzae TaxID=379684 RepID=UPI003D086CD0
MGRDIRIGRRRFMILAGSGLVSLAIPRPSDAAEQSWQAMRSGKAIVLMRHAQAPGTGDPEGFRLGDCRTQRNLSEAGRSDARAVGALFRQNGISAARVYSSQWCRCLDTARLLGLGPVTEQPLLNSFFDSRGDGDRQTRGLQNWMSEQTGSTPIVLVTHQVNITSLTGIFPASGELIVITKPNGGPITVLNRISLTSAG